MNIGRRNQLRIYKLVTFGAYLTDGSNEILLPGKYLPKGAVAGDLVDVFVYLDSEDRPVATTQHPLAQADEIAFLNCKSMTPIGAFLDWGLEKDLFVPFKHQSERMIANHSYVVKVLFDEKSGRIIASNTFNKILHGKVEKLTLKQQLPLIVYEETPIGFKVIADQQYLGLIYKNQIFRPVKIGDRLTGFVLKLREDNRIDLTLDQPGIARIQERRDPVLQALKDSGGFLPITAKTPPAVIKARFEMSKKTFKQAIGMLYKERKITIEDDGIRLVK